jgi:hypothetical protein
MKFVLAFIATAIGTIPAVQAQTTAYGPPSAYGVQTAPTRYGPHGATSRQYGYGNDVVLVITTPHKPTMVCHEYADRIACK